jgi:hypothetical protein
MLVAVKPGPQIVQLVAPSEPEAVPRLHDEQVDRPWLGAKLPAGQATQRDRP